MAALAGLGGFSAWLLKDYIAYLKSQIEAWKSMAVDATGVVGEVASAARRHTALTPEEAEKAKEQILRAGRE